MYLEKWNAYNKNQNNRTSILLHWLHSFSETETSWSKIRLGLKTCICLLLLKPPSFGFVWQRGHNGLCNAKTMSLLQRSKTGDHPRWKERCVVQLIFFNLCNLCLTAPSVHQAILLLSHIFVSHLHHKNFKDKHGESDETDDKSTATQRQIEVKLSPKQQRFHSINSDKILR